MNENNVAGRELGWDDEISVESTNFTVLQPGEYEFTVTNFERSRHNGSAKLPPCNKAVVTMTFESPEGVSTIKENFFMYSTCEGLISNFMIAIGLKKEGEPTRMNWPATIGRKGRAKLGIRTYTGNDGTERQANEIKNFIKPTTSTAPSWKAGSF